MIDERRAREIQVFIRKLKADLLNSLRILDGLAEEIDVEQSKPKRRIPPKREENRRPK